MARVLRSGRLHSPARVTFLLKGFLADDVPAASRRPNFYFATCCHLPYAIWAPTAYGALTSPQFHHARPAARARTGGTDPFSQLDLLEHSDWPSGRLRN